MTADIPPDVRGRAATAARAAWLNASAPVAETWPAVVDAVAEVLAADQPKSTWPGDDFDGVRDFLALKAATGVLMLATPRTRARIQIAIVRSRGGVPSERLLRLAELERGPGD
jgi:hypothetical protein